MPHTILLLAANPKDTQSLRLSEELRDVLAHLQHAKYADHLHPRLLPAARPDDIGQAMLESKPRIVHFAGHGEGADGIVLENDAGEAQLASTEALQRLFKTFAEHVDCVVLNACYTQEQAAAIAEHIPVVVGMRRAVSDQTATAFAKAFYQAVGNGETYRMAFDYAVSMVGLKNLESDIPQLNLRDGAEALSLFRPDAQADLPRVEGQSGSVTQTETFEAPQNVPVQVTTLHRKNEVPPFLRASMLILFTAIAASLIWYMFLWKAEFRLEQEQKTAVAIGAAFAMLGQSSQMVAPRVFTSALEEAGIPSESTLRLSMAFDALEDDWLQQGTNANLEHEKKSLLNAVEAELRNVFHQEESIYIRFGHDLVRLTLLLRYWDRLRDDPILYKEVAESLGGLQEGAEKVQLSEEVRRGLLNLHVSRLYLPEEREVARQLLNRALRRYDFTTTQD